VSKEELLKQIKEKGFDPLAFRLMVLGTHYRQKQNFTWTALRSAALTLQKLQQTVQGWDAPGQLDESLMQEFLTAVEDDLNMPKALAVLWKAVDADLPSAVKAATVLAMDRVFGLSLSEYVARPISIPSTIQDFLNQRREARERKDWSASDRLREQILAAGWVVEDAADGQHALPALPELPSV
jgi:cysteinyl-tRNA synthetase